MPATSIRDLVVHDQDLVVGTHGRSFWILDDVTPLRQADGSMETRLFRPHEAVRARWNTNTDTPLPPDEPGGQNPPDGAVIDYRLAGPARTVTLEIVDAAGRVVRRHSSADSLPPVRTEGNIPWWWVRPARRPGAEAGMHRFVWDLHEAEVAAPERSYPISATPGDTPREPRGPWALPGAYTVRLTVDGRAYTQPLVVRMDPRVRTPPAALAQQHATSLRLADGLRRAAEALGQLHGVRSQLQALRGKGGPEVTASVAALDSTAASIEEGGPGLRQLAGDLATLYDLVEGADAAPTSQALAAVDARLAMLDAALARWRTLRERDLDRLNQRLRAGSLAPVSIRDEVEHAAIAGDDEDEP